ncbi:hypothetical protein STRCI_005453 [Streptomyces cinnabarinus]|uniref:Secreted protein n=1 Tax=Streptomyces cinnabarinus TaxID=67287 RepID=A0ABY7KLT9_9ACTN|nr:hypothetical protein [Streptomyces cinnabarinus]WAZ24067.1 hypothetical protein STRCI_005453 [Streptomyces cinnabarinus]
MVAWAATVTVAGGLTLWLQDAGEPERPQQRQRSEPHPEHYDDSDCPGPGVTPTPRDDGMVVLCAYTRAR